MTQRIEPFFFLMFFFFEKNSKIWTLFQKKLKNLNSFPKKWLKELNIFSCMTQWMEPFWTWPNELNLLEHDSKNWTFFSENNDSNNWNFLSMTQRIVFFFECDSKNWIFEFSKKKKTTQTIELFWKIRYKEPFLFSSMTQRLEPFSNIFLKKNDSKNWSFFSLWLSKWNIFEVRIRLTEFFFSIRLTELNLFFFLKMTFYFRHWTFFLNTTQRIEILQYDSEDSIFLWYDSKYWTFLYDTLWIELFFFKKYDLTHRIEPLFMNLSSRWLKELKSFFLTQRIEPFLFSNVTQRIEIFFLKMSQRI